MVVDFDLLKNIAGRNFRDLGGHPTGEGRRVKTGMVYRSSHLARVPDEHPVRQLAVRTLVTLQSRAEVKHLGPPHEEVLRDVRWEHIPIGDRWFRRDGASELRDQPGKEHLVMVMGFRSDWRKFFKILAEREVYPLVFHCSAGRDRTGVGAAMLLEMLGVERELIVNDFLHSNHVFPSNPLTATQLDPLFEIIDELGGIRPFMDEVIGLTDVEMGAIRADLLD